MIECGFHEWLSGAKRTNDPAGDLVDDMRRDRRVNPLFPIDFPNLRFLQAYLIERGACDGAFFAARVVWRRFARWLAREAKP